MSNLPLEEPPRGLPSHPDLDDAPDAGPQRPAVNWAMVLVLALIGVFVVVILVLHLTGVVGPAGHD
jgi:hypothetical protein